MLVTEYMERGDLQRTLALDGARGEPRRLGWYRPLAPAGPTRCASAPAGPGLATSTWDSSSCQPAGKVLQQGAASSPASTSVETYQPAEAGASSGPKGMGDALEQRSREACCQGGPWSPGPSSRGGMELGLGWRIALDISRGLAFLHAHKVELMSPMVLNATKIDVVITVNEYLHMLHTQEQTAQP